MFNNWQISLLCFILGLKRLFPYELVSRSLGIGKTFCNIHYHVEMETIHPAMLHSWMILQWAVIRVPQRRCFWRVCILLGIWVLRFLKMSQTLHRMIRSEQYMLEDNWINSEMLLVKWHLKLRSMKLNSWLWIHVREGQWTKITLAALLDNHLLSVDRGQKSISMF